MQGCVSYVKEKMCKKLVQIGQEVKKPSKPVIDTKTIIPLIQKTNWENCILFPADTSLLKVRSHNKEKPKLVLVFFSISSFLLMNRIVLDSNPISMVRNPMLVMRKWNIRYKQIWRLKFLVLKDLMLIII